MFKGGYKLIDLRDNNITVGGDAVTIVGIYASIEHNYRKPTVLTGLTVGGVEKEDTFVNFEHGENTYSGLLAMPESDKLLYISVTNEDAVTITEVALS